MLCSEGIEHTVLVFCFVQCDRGCLQTRHLAIGLTCSRESCNAHVGHCGVNISLGVSEPFVA